MRTSANTLIHRLAQDIIWKNLLGVKPSNCPLNGNDTKGKVGEVIQKLPIEQREILKQLTSKEAANIRLFGK